ncbi:hypothetical protein METBISCDRAFT_31300 [Metschnikowia bicuspidata]|uniref:N-acetyltransferase domain-containing protein n=1 Tax=Metschnikowia bicuspidata TaxID=27322 RepID=A0A4P9ZC74_9ASCO|nr:hypothetical protein METBISCDRAFT_31300 [Metschnikowia bicuspidata]
MAADFDFLATLPFADKTHALLPRVTEKIVFLLEKNTNDFPAKLLVEAFHEFKHMIRDGKKYPFDTEFAEFWHGCFLGYFYVKPIYLGRSSHVCNGGFVVDHRRRGLGLGKEMGKQYLAYVPLLGYLYSVFNLVYGTNVASWKIWDLLRFERIGYVKNVAVLKG